MSITSLRLDEQKGSRWISKKLGCDSLVDWSPKVIGLLAEVKKRCDLLKALNTQTIDSFAEPNA